MIPSVHLFLLLLLFSFFTPEERVKKMGKEVKENKENLNTFNSLERKVTILVSQGPHSQTSLFNTTWSQTLWTGISVPKETELQFPRSHPVLLTCLTTFHPAVSSQTVATEVVLCVENVRKPQNINTVAPQIVSAKTRSHSLFGKSLFKPQKSCK